MRPLKDAHADVLVSLLSHGAVVGKGVLDKAVVPASDEHRGRELGRASFVVNATLQEFVLLGVVEDKLTQRARAGRSVAEIRRNVKGLEGWKEEKRD